MEDTVSVEGTGCNTQCGGHSEDYTVRRTQCRGHGVDETLWRTQCGGQSVDDARYCASRGSQCDSVPVRLSAKCQVTAYI